MSSTNDLISILKKVTCDLECTIELLNNECQPGFMNNVKKAKRILKKVTPDKDNQVIIIVGMDKKRKSKIAYDLGQYSDNLPDDVECEDWLIQLLSDKFKGMPDALDCVTRIRE